MRGSHAPQAGGGRAGSPLSHLVELLRCLDCGGQISVAQIAERPGYPDLGPDGALCCARCAAHYPLIAGTARMLDRRLLPALRDAYPLAAKWVSASVDNAVESSEDEVKRRTAESFTYEWARFGALREEWGKNFFDYMHPRSAEFFRDRLLLDVGAGSGRHSHVASQVGANVVAVDFGSSIDVARRNLPPSVLTVQADAERLPFGPATFDIVMSIGVLHHLPDPERALRSVTTYIAPLGYLRIYLYWWPQQAWQRAVLRGVQVARRVTVGLPHPVLHLLCYPLAAALFATVVLPHRLLRGRRLLGRLVESLPLGSYADYPFGVLLNDQFDRLSAPLEQRYTRAQVAEMLTQSGLTDVEVLPHHGWLGEGRRAIDG